MASVKISLDSKAMEDLLNDDDMMDKALRPHAQRILAAAKALAPVSSGSYLAGLDIVDAVTDRYGLRVGSDVRHALLVESRLHVLQRSLDG